MNNLRLVVGLLCATPAIFGAVAYSQTVVTLEELFTTAEANSAQLRPLLTAQKEAKMEISVAKSERLPDINASLTASFIGNGFTTRRDFTNYEIARIPHLGTGMNVTVSQPVYSGGAITSTIRMAELKEKATAYATDQKRDNLRIELTDLYLDVYRCMNQRKVVAGNIVSAENVLSNMKARFEQGTALQNDITRYELLLSNLKLEQLRLDNSLEILNTNLVRISGLPEGTKIMPDSTMLARSLRIQNLSQWQEDAVASSPTLSLARTGEKMSLTAEKKVRADMLPKVGIQAGWTIGGPILVEIPPINRNLSYWWIGVGVNCNLSSLYKTNKSVKKSRIATRHAKEEYEAVKEGVELAVNADYIKYLEACEVLKTREKAVELAERNYEVTSTRYSADMALITDMLDATNARLDAQQQLVNARIDIIYYYYHLLFTTGKI